MNLIIHKMLKRHFLNSFINQNQEYLNSVILMEQKHITEIKNSTRKKLKEVVPITMIFSGCSAIVYRKKKSVTQRRISSYQECKNKKKQRLYKIKALIPRICSLPKIQKLNAPLRLISKRVSANITIELSTQIIST